MNMKNLLLICAIVLMSAVDGDALPGDLDTTFGGSGGYVLTDVFGTLSNEALSDVAVQSDGKLIVSGNGFVARFSSDGTIDGSFDLDGVVSFPTCTLGVIALQSDGKIVFAGRSLTGADLCVFRLNSDGSPDTGFDLDGSRTILNVGGAVSITLQTDGKILVGTNWDGGAFPANARALVVRLNPDGSSDNTFDSDGLRFLNTSGVWYPYGLAVQTDGKIVAAGRTSLNATLHDIAVARLNADGSFDSGFDGDGIVFTVIPSEESESRDVLIQSDGKVVVVGASDLGGEDPLIVRYQSNGALDTSFDGDGYRSFELSGNNEDYFFAETVQQPDGKLLAIAYGSAAYGFFVKDDYYVLRLNSDGSDDNSFDFNGRVKSQWCENPSGIALTNDGKIVVAGGRDRPEFATSNKAGCIQRFNSNGSVDYFFNPTPPNGRAVLSSVPFDEIEAVAGLPDGKILVAGWGVYSGVTDARLVRLNANGSLDTEFMDEGSFVRAGSFGIPAYFYDILVLGDGSFYVGGDGGANGAIIAKFTSAGTLDTSFSGDGIATTASAQRFHGLAIQSDLKILGCGSAGTSTRSGRVIRFSTTGTAEISATNNLGATGLNNEILDCARQSDGKLIVAGYGFDGTSDSIRISRHLTTLSVDTSFGTGGVTTTDLSAALNERAGEVVIQSDNKIVVASTGLNGGGDRDFAVLRYDANGTLDPTLAETFGSGGVSLIDFVVGSPDDEANSILLQPDGQFIVGGSSVDGSGGRFALTKLNPGGSPALGFGTLGRVRTSFVNDQASIKALAFYLDNRVIAGGRSWNGWNYEFTLARYENELIPTAATSFVSGRVMTAKGQGIRDVLVTITDRNGISRSVRTGSFGIFRFDDLAVNETYVVTVASKRYAFASPSAIVTLKDGVLDLNFVSE